MGEAVTESYDALERAIIHEDYETMNIALLVSLLRRFRCSSNDLIRERCSKIEKEFERRGIDPDSISGFTGFNSP